MSWDLEGCGATFFRGGEEGHIGKRKGTSEGQNGNHSGLLFVSLRGLGGGAGGCAAVVETKGSNTFLGGKKREGSTRYAHRGVINPPRACISKSYKRGRTIPGETTKEGFFTHHDGKNKKSLNYVLSEKPKPANCVLN